MTKTRSRVRRSLTVLALMGALASQGGHLKARQAAGSRVPVKQKEPVQTHLGREQAAAQAPRETFWLLPPTGVRSFTGRVVNVGGQYLLEDALVGVTYVVDPQQAVSEFEGMTVRLNGVLDPSGKIIRLERPLR